MKKVDCLIIWTRFRVIKVLTTTDIVASVIDYDPVSLAISLASKAKSELIPSAD